MQNKPENVLWIPILTALGEETVSRILDNSPDVQSALLEAHADFDAAETEARALRGKGHEGEQGKL
jgi:hypothetical protein